jgi:hypothetical protein
MKLPAGKRQDAVDSALARQIKEIERTFSDRWEW